MNDPIQKEIEAKGLTAPRVTPADIEANIAGELYFTGADAVEGVFAFGSAAAQGQYVGMDKKALRDATRLLTFCVLILKNGHTVTGESACASPENFDAEIGRKIARKNAVKKVWPLLGFRLRDAIHEGRTNLPPRYRCTETGEPTIRGYAETNPTTTLKES